MQLWRLVFIIILFTCSPSFQEDPPERIKDSNDPSPLILVPGIGGSRAYSKLKIFDYIEKPLIWVNYICMFWPSLLTKLFKLEYDPRTHKTRDTPLSHVYFPGWGSTETIENLDSWKHKKTSYFENLVNDLVKDKFYVRNKTIRGAPYDFRKAPNENKNFTIDLKNLIEETYKISGYQRVVILGHSMGSLYVLDFLQKMTISWKKQYIRAFLSVSGPLAGAVNAVIADTIGISFGSIRNPLNFRNLERSFPSTIFLFPKREIFGKDPLVITPKRNYSAYDFPELFQDMSMIYGTMMYNDTKDIVNGQETPEGIDELFCIHSYGSKTKKQMVFESFPDGKPKIIYGDGDGTVNIESLEICKHWENVQYTTIPNVEHMKIVGDQIFIKKIRKILYKQPNTMLEIEPLRSTKSDDNFNIIL